MNGTGSPSTYLRFGFDGPLSLRDELGCPFVEIAVTLGRVRVPTKIALWRQDGTGIVIWSEMHDLAEKVEVGVLMFAMTTRTEEKEPDGYWETIETFSAAAFNGQNSISKLVIEESGYCCESGLVVTPGIGDECFVVADAFPCHIALLGLEGLRSASGPEYDLSCYKRISW